MTKKVLPITESPVKEEAGIDPVKGATKKASTRSKSEKPVIKDESTSSREVEVDFTHVEPHKKVTKERVPMSESQQTVYDSLKLEIPKWDSGKLTKCSMDVLDGQICMYTEVTQKNGSRVTRKLYIGRNGAIRAYGKKVHSKLTKLLRDYDDVVKYGKKVEEPEV